jgi:uncharacterized membrane protein
VAGSDDPRTDGSRPLVATSDAGWIVLVAVTTVYTLLTARWALRNHDGFGTLGFDLGNFDQGVWLLSQFERPSITIMGRHLFGDHTSFILLPFVPVYWVLPSAKVLLVAQACALGLSAVPVFLIARDKLGHELLAAGIAVAFLAHPVLGWTNFDQFHPDAFEVPLVLFAFWFMLRHRWRPFLACVVALLLVKEDAGLLTLALGGYVAVRHDRRVGLLAAGISAAYLALAFAVIKPGLGVPSDLNMARVPFGGFGDLARAALTRPWDVVTHLTTDGRPWYAWQLVASFGLVSLLAPEVLLVAVGPFAFNLLSTFTVQHRIQYHYGTLLLPVLAVAAVYGIAKAGTLRHRAVLVAVMMAGALASAYLWGPLPGSRNPAFIGDPTTPFARDARAALSLVPDDASVSAFYPFTTHLTHRVHVYEFPNPFRARWWHLHEQEGRRLPQADGVEYVVLPKASGYWTPELRQVAASLEAEFAPVFDTDQVVLLRRCR